MIVVIEGVSVKDPQDLSMALDIARCDPFQHQHHVELRSVVDELEWRWLMTKAERYGQAFDLHQRKQAA